jgi:hypothetical protein
VAIILFNLLVAVLRLGRGLHDIEGGAPASGSVGGARWLAVFVAPSLARYRRAVSHAKRGCAELERSSSSGTGRRSPGGSASMGVVDPAARL